jgi:hypothetical protein
MAVSGNPRGPQADIRVFIQDGEGRYLCRGDDCWYFGGDKTFAVVMHYVADRVPEQLAALRAAEGLVLEAVPVPLEEIYEACDRCQELFMPTMILFDGVQFLCPDCRVRAARHVRKP